MGSDAVDDRAAAAVALGFLHRRAGRLEQCEAAWRGAADLGHADLSPFARLQLGELFQASSRWEDAAQAYLEAARSGSAEHAPPAALGLAMILGEVGQAAAAHNLLQWVVETKHPDVAPIAEELLQRRAAD